MPSPYVLALLRERAGYQRDPRKQHRVIEVDDELGKQGYGVNSDGKLVELAKVTPAAKKFSPPRERAVLKAPETAVPKD